MPGWIKLHRELTRKPIWACSTPEQKVILVTLLMMANFEDEEWEWKGERYKCKPGEFVTSLKSIAERAGSGISVQNVRTALARFERYDFLTSESTNRNRKITIVNWGKYQGLEISTNKQTNRQLTSHQQATNKPLTTSKKDKKDKKVRSILSKNTETLIIETWNSLDTSQVHSLSPTTARYKNLTARVEDYGLDKVLETLKLVGQSDFLLGKKGDWKASFDWVVKPNNFIKVMEGQYTDKKKARPVDRSEEKKLRGLGVKL